MECQKICQPNRAALARDCFGVMELEVMKFVAYCSGLTIKLRVDESQFGCTEHVSWGLASLRTCVAAVVVCDGIPPTFATWKIRFPRVSLSCSMLSAYVVVHSC